jgi:hypothetical protein
VELLGNWQQRLGINDERATGIDEVLRLWTRESP